MEKFEKAAEELAKALELFPCWPEGQFNCALFNGEIGSLTQLPCSTWNFF